MKKLLFFFAAFVFMSFKGGISTNNQTESYAAPHCATILTIGGRNYEVSVYYEGSATSPTSSYAFVYDMSGNLVATGRPKASTVGWVCGIHYARITTLEDIFEEQD